jgi:hypothetical protein
MLTHGKTKFYVISKGKKRMKKLLFTLLIMYYALFSLLNAASVKATVSNSEVVQGNMIQLKITATGNMAEFPNIKKIGSAPVLGRHHGQNNSYTYINGKMKNIRTATLVLTFAPQKDMTIPSYSVNIDGTMYKTKPINIKIIKSTLPKSGNNAKFSLQLQSDKKSVVVGEPLLATVYFSLQNGVRLSENPQYNKPEFKGFFVKEVGNEKSYNEGKRQVTELRYMLIPQSEGNFTVGPATAKIGVADRNRRDMFGRFFGTTWVPIASNIINIEVKAKVQDSDLVGSFTMEQHIDSKNVKANKPVNLTVKITGEGSLEDFEFPNYEIDNVTVYSDDAKITTDLNNNTITSTYVKSFAFISDHDFEIPAKSISVYDTKLKTLKELTIPSYKISIKDAKQLKSVAVSDLKENRGVVQTNLKIPEKSMLDSGEPEVSIEKNITEWWMVILAFVSGMMVMLLSRYLPSFKMKTHSRNYSDAEALKILYPHMSRSSEIEEMVRKLYAKKNGNKNVVIDKQVLKEILDKIQTLK